MSLPFLMAMAWAAIGIETDLVRLGGRGMAPLLFSLLLTIFIAAFSLALILFFIREALCYPKRHQKFFPVTSLSGDVPKGEVNPPKSTP